MYVIPRLRLNSEFKDYKIPSKREQFNYCIKSNVVYSQDANFTNTLPERIPSKIEQIQLGAKRFYDQYKSDLFDQLNVNDTSPADPPKTE